MFDLILTDIKHSLIMLFIIMGVDYENELMQPV